MDSVSTRMRGAEDVRVASTTPEALSQAIARGQAYLLQQQAAAGYWVAELESDVSVAAGFIPLMRFLGTPQPEREQKIVALLWSRQLPDGGWSSYAGGPGNLDVSVQAYFALKLAGVQAEDASMLRARAFILSKGGVNKTHTFTKILIAPFGQYGWEGLPSIPPELMLLPDWSPFTIYDFASWARATIVDLMVVLAQKPVCHIPESQSIFELYPEPRDHLGWSVPKPEKRLSWEGAFTLLDRLLKIWDVFPFHPLRGKALRKAIGWIEKHQEADGSWGGIMLPWVYSLMALKSVGRSLDDPVMARAIDGLQRFIVEEESSFRLQPAMSPIWDTALAMIALSDSGVRGDHPSLVRAARWLLDEQVLQEGDWRVKNPHTEPGAWAFEFDNDLYPDVDDTAAVSLALMRVDLPEKETKHAAIARGQQWILDMQSKDGGWAAFDRDNNLRILAKIPFADFMTPLDPTSVDVTAHVVELLVGLGDLCSQVSCRKALGYLKDRQETDGSWYGRWGVNYVYGTGAVLPALRAAGEEVEADCIQRGVAWLKQVQNQDGGWGETCQSYEDPSLRGQGASTPSQSAWAILGLLACSEGDSDAVRRGIAYLLDTQAADGTWEEQQYTGTGFPKAFYLKYHMYRIYFPLMALARFQRWREREEGR